MAKISVVIPVYNREKLVGRAIKSVLDQTFGDYEIIVIDDGSVDGTKKVVQRYKGRIKYIYQENKGISTARNRGIQEASGEYIAFLDSDDTWAPEKLEIQLDLMQKNERLGLVCSRMVILNENGDQCGMKPEKKTGKNFKELVEIGGDLPTSSVMTRRVCFEEVGMFDESLVMMEDFEMWVRIASQYDIYMDEDKILAHYYRHDRQITKSRTLVYETTVQLHKKILGHFGATKDFPRKIVKRKISSNEYVLSRIYYRKRDYRNAFKVLRDAMGRCPLVGVEFIEKTDSILTKVIKFIKPFGYFVVCYVNYCIHLKR